MSHKKKTLQVTTKKQKNKRTDGKKCKVEAHGDENKDNQAKVCLPITDSDTKLYTFHTIRMYT